MIAVILIVLLVLVVVGLLGILIKGLIWLTIIAAVLFLITIFLGGSRAGKRRISH